MPRPRPPHLHLEITRHGRKVWYVRVDKGPRIRIRAEFGTPDFDQEYQAAISGSAAPAAKGVAGRRHAGVADREIPGFVRLAGLLAGDPPPA